MMNIGACSVLNAELWAILKGLNLCQDKGWRRIVVEIDNMLAIQLLMKPLENINNQWAFCSAIKQLLEKPWRVDILHTYWKGNWVTDYLSKMGTRIGIKTRVFEDPSTEVLQLLDVDAGKS